MMKYVLIIGDGMADNPVPELGNRTPLQVAKKDAIDQLARKGIVGSVVNCPEGLPPGSDTAILSIFGNDPWKCYTGRAPLEAAATGIQLKPGDVGYRCNMVALEEGDQPFAEKKILSHSGGSIDGEESIALVNDLFADPDFQKLAKEAGMIVHPAPSFRHIAVQSKVGHHRYQTDPGLMTIWARSSAPFCPPGCANAAVLSKLMEVSYQVLDNHPINQARRAAGKLPANGVWFWAEGTGVALDSFVEKYQKSGSVISAVPLCQGIARLGGLKVTEVEGATGELETNYEGKVQAALKDLAGGCDFTAVHLEAPDECTHNGDTPGKLQAIEWLSSRIVAPLVAGMDQAGYDYRILILSDHKTLTSTRAMTAIRCPT